MPNIIIYILGFLSAIIILPIINMLVEILYTWAEVVKSKLALEISITNNEIAKLGGRDVNAIGFQANDDENVLEFDEEEDFDFPPSSKRTIGFSGGSNVKAKK